MKSATSFALAANNRSLPADDGRMVWMDLARGLAVSFVILLHCATYLKDLGEPVPDWLRTVNAAFRPLRMPLLVFLSGMLLNRSLTKPPFIFAYGKFRSLLWPYVVWVVVFCIASGQPYLLLKPSPWAGGTHL
jgi:fucose 4-O-acetylase-like acetyltransferase